MAHGNPAAPARVRGGHRGVAVLLDLERSRPLVLDRRRRRRCSDPTPGLPPHENTSFRAHPMPIS
jgi:hypothetical protein